MSNLPADPPNVKAVIPQRLADARRWTAWVVIPARKPGTKPGKKPLSLTNDPATWLTLDAALARAGGRVGYQMYGATTLVGLDLDNCIDPDTGAPSKLAQAILDSLPDTYAEVTPSGRGFRLFASLDDGDPAPPEFLSREYGVECYVGRSARFLTVTGNVLPGREGKLARFTEAARRILVPLAGAEVVPPEITLPVPQTPRVEAWKELFDKRRGSPRAELLRFLSDGDVPGVRSEQTYAVACWMLSRRYSPEEVFAVLHSAPGSWEAALDKRDQDPARARALLWADIGRAQKVIVAEARATEGEAEAWSALNLHVEIQNKKLQVVASQSNALRVLADHEEYRGRVALDITTGLVLLDGTPMDDARFFDLQERICRFCGWKPTLGRQWWSDALRAAAARNVINPRASWLRSLAWDGTPRLDSWLNDHVAAEKDPLNVAIGRKWLLSLVARWLNPGCKCDTVLILIGREGTRKTTFFEVMAGGAERVTTINGFERDDKMVASAGWIVEMPEAHLFRRADQNRLKAFITEPCDTFRPPYAAAPITVKRGYVLVSTANADEVFQPGQDGLRRFWPVFVRDEHIDLEWVENNREQLLAEAVVAVDLEEEWWFTTTPEALRVRQQQAVEDTAVDDAIRILVNHQAGKGGLTLAEIMSELVATLGMRPNDRLVASLLPKHGVVKKRNALARLWMHPSWAAKDNVVQLTAAAK